MNDTEKYDRKYNGVLWPQIPFKAKCVLWLQHPILVLKTIRSGP